MGNDIPWELTDERLALPIRHPYRVERNALRRRAYRWSLIDADAADIDAYRTRRRAARWCRLLNEERAVLRSPYWPIGGRVVETQECVEARHPFLTRWF